MIVSVCLAKGAIAMSRKKVMIGNPDVHQPFASRLVSAKPPGSRQGPVRVGSFWPQSLLCIENAWARSPQHDRRPARREVNLIKSWIVHLQSLRMLQVTEKRPNG